MWFDDLYKSIECKFPDTLILRNLQEDKERILYTIEFLRKLGIKKNVFVKLV